MFMEEKKSIPPSKPGYVYLGQSFNTAALLAHKKGDPVLPGMVEDIWAPDTPSPPLPPARPDIKKTVLGEWETPDGYFINARFAKPVIRQGKLREVVKLETLPKKLQWQLEDDIEEAQFRELGGTDYVLSQMGEPHDPSRAAFWKAAAIDGKRVNFLDMSIPGDQDQPAAEDSDLALPPIIDGADFIRKEIKEPKEIIGGLLHQASKLVIGGGSKSFKTWLLIYLALCVAHGHPWLKFRTTPGKVLLINFELQEFACQRRVVAIAKKLGIQITHGNIFFWNLRGHSADYWQILPQITAVVRKLGFSLIIFDPIYKMYGQRGQLNRASDVAQLMNALEKLTVETGAAIAFGAHFSKGNQSAKESIDRISGSGVFARDPDSLLMLTAHETKDCFTVESTLRNFPTAGAFRCAVGIPAHGSGRIARPRRP